jgi:hypothetical protein
MHKVLLVRDTTNNIALLQHCDACLHLMLPFLCHLAIKWLICELDPSSITLATLCS